MADRPILVLGVGNLLLQDDGVGLRLLEMLEAETDSGIGSAVDFVDGGTQGLSLLSQFANRESVLVLDAVCFGAEPGAVHVTRGAAIQKMRARRASTGHESNCLELIETARLLGYDPPHIAVVGVEPARVQTGIGLSAEVDAGLGGALAQAREILNEFAARAKREQIYVSGSAR